MAYEWSIWLVDALRADPFVASRLVLVEGWETRGRPSDAYAPTGVLEHHTACMTKVGHDPANCLSGILAGNSVAPGPISQLLGTWTPLGVKWNGQNPDPRILVVAAGRSNHAGAGVYPWGAPSGNGSSIGIEWCGPPSAGSWPDIVIELRERVTAAILRHRSWPIGRVTTHWEYATPKGRKVDPQGAWPGEPTLTSSAPWSPDRWRSAVAARLVPPAPPPTPDPTPPPNPGDLDMTAATMFRDPRWLNVFVLGSCPATNVSPKLYASLVARGVPVIVEQHDQLIATCLHQSGLTAADLVPAG